MKSNNASTVSKKKQQPTFFFILSKYVLSNSDSYLNNSKDEWNIHVSREQISVNTTHVFNGRYCFIYFFAVGLTFSSLPWPFVHPDMDSKPLLTSSSSTGRWQAVCCRRIALLHLAVLGKQRRKG